MKKLLLIILIGFIVVSTLTIIFTVQNSDTFTFEEENGGNGDDRFIMIDMNLIENNTEKTFSYLFSNENENFYPLITPQKGLIEILLSIYL